MRTPKKNIKSGSINGFKLIEAKTEGQQEYLDSIKTNKITFCIGPAGTGKAQPLDSLVYTVNGPKRMGDINIGEKICTPDGKYAEIIGIYPQGLRDIYKITFKNGDTVEASDEHLWQINSESSRGWSNKIVDTLYIKNNYKSPKGRNNLNIKCPKPIYFEPQKISIDPYMLGILLGDGCFRGNSLTLSSDDIEIITSVKNILVDGYNINKIPNNKYDYIITHGIKSKANIYQKYLKELKLWGLNSYEKFIPKNYLYNSVKIRTAILQGLMDTDGTVEDNGYTYLCTTSETMANQFKILVQSLGGVCKIIPKIKKFKYKGKIKIGKTAYYCSIKFDDFPIFRLTRKTSYKNKKYFVKRIISSVEYIGKKECQCILIDHPDHLYITDNCIITHNTYLATRFAAGEFLAGVYHRIIITRPMVQAGENTGFLPGDILAKMDPFVRPVYDELRPFFETCQLKEYLEDGTIEVLPYAYMRGRTFHRSLILADESQNATFEQLKLLLTRFGQGSKMIVNGDVTQSDLPQNSRGALFTYANLLKGVTGINTIFLENRDIQREELVSKILSRIDK